MHVATHVVAAVVALSASFLIVPAWAQTLVAPVPGVAQGPKLGEMDVKAYQKIPKLKVAVQLTSDSHLSRELRRQVMIRLAQRGNEVGFSGGNVMRMDVSFFDLLGGYDRNAGTIGGQPDYAPPGSNPRMALPGNPIGRRDGLSSPTSSPTLRITLTLYTKDGGQVLWTASGSCATQADKAQRAGEAIINRIFDNADHNASGDAGCPL
jgi:hypothetical protein